MCDKWLAVAHIETPPAGMPDALSKREGMIQHTNPQGGSVRAALAARAKEKDALRQGLVMDF
jgi:hypothetical protein